ncbi:MAG: TrmH family RNA methyltransferase [Anaerolineae bacterium]
MITSLTNRKVKFVRRLQNDRRFRVQESAFVVEGVRWLTELQLHACRPIFVLYTEVWGTVAEHAALLTQLDAPAQQVSAEVMAAMSDTQTPPGVIAVAPIRPVPLPGKATFFLILDAIGNPGNLGTMLRTAAAAGVDGVLLAPGCVDAYNPKVIRGSMGAHLHLPIHRADWGEIGALTAGMTVWLAAAGDGVSHTAVNWRKPSAIIIGNEGAGVGREARNLSANRVSIPMQAATESLNAAVAAGIILFEVVRQRTAKGAYSRKSADGF